MMIKTFISTLILVVALIAGYYIKVFEFSLEPNYRWVRIYNSSECQLRAIDVVMPDRTVKITREQMEHTHYPYKSEAEFYIPLLVSDTKDFAIEADFIDCSLRKGSVQQFPNSLYTDVFISKETISYAAR